jgi:hypothetical protein
MRLVCDFGKPRCCCDDAGDAGGNDQADDDQADDDQVDDDPADDARNHRQASSAKKRIVSRIGCFPPFRLTILTILTMLTMRFLASSGSSVAANWLFSASYLFHLFYG